MKTIFRNFYLTISRFKLASVLNILGLTIAFTAFTVIMTQVYYDLNFDQFHPKAERTYRIEPSFDGVTYINGMHRPLGEKIITLSPDIELGSIFLKTKGSFYLPESDPDNTFSETITYVSEDFMEMMRFRFVEGDGKGIKNLNDVIVSKSIAKKLFPNQKAVGKEILIKNEKEAKSLVITGVYLDFPSNSILESNGIYTNIGDDYLTTESSWNLEYFVTLNSVDSKGGLEGLLEKLAKDDFKRIDKFRFRITALTDLHFSTEIPDSSVPIANKTTVMLLLSVAILILIIAIINFLNFAMALTPLRVRRINIQKILGSSTAALRLFQIIEAILFALISFGLSLVVVDILSTTTFTTLMIAPLGISSNIEVVIITAIVAILAGVAAGILPAFYSTSFQPAMVIKSSFGNSNTGRRFRTLLISFQYISSIVLFCGAVFMIIQNNYMQNHPVGFDRENIICGYTSNTIASSSEAVKAKLMSNPAIKGVVFSQGATVSNFDNSWGREYKGESIFFNLFPVTPDFVKFMGMEIVEGRDFREEDMLKENGTFIFNEQAVAQYGLKVGEGLYGHSDTIANIVGVVKNFNFQPMQYGITPMALYVFGSKPWWELTYINIKIASENMPATIALIKETLTEFDPKWRSTRLDFMDEFIGKLYKKEQNQATLISIFALTAMLISLIGVFGLVFFETQYRRKEIGLRKINGATIALVLEMFNRKFIYTVCLCFLIALPIAIYAINNWLESFAYRTPVYWWVFALALLIVLLLTTITVTIQSYKAAAENPIKSLRSES